MSELMSETISAPFPLSDPRAKEIVFAGGEVNYYGHHEYPRYWVTDSGRIFSERSNRFLKPIRMGEYCGVTIVNRHGELVKRYLHRLILEIMTGVCPPGLQACHNNGDKTDNRVVNLRWDTPQANNDDKRAHGTVACGEKNPMAKLTWESVREIRVAAAEQGRTQRSIAAEYAVSNMTISRIARGQMWNEDPCL